MSALMPVETAAKLREGIAQYLSTTFALSDNTVQRTLEDFLKKAPTSMFHGPYVRTRMPFAPGEREPREVLDWVPEWFRPYGHQAAAFERLSSKPAEGSMELMRQPEPTLIVTGTGSGKTEGFLYPILDHARRMRRRGITGTKALLLYPMNALATDQAERLTSLLLDEAELAGVTAGIYTGEHSGAGRTKVSPAGLITDRFTMRETPPDILLTNYKMLDQLLMRSDDAPIWELSAKSLQYVVLDEFHTYDGAQGTDVALLLRRLGLTIATHLGEEAAGDTAALGSITPVATSATLGDEGDTTQIREFARTVFGVEFGPESVLTETRLSVDEWGGPITRGAEEFASLIALDGLAEAVDRRREVGATAAEAGFGGVGTLVFGVNNPHEHLDECLAAARGNGLVREIYRHSAAAISLPDLSAAVLPQLHPKWPDKTETFIAHVLGALGYLRAAITAQSSWEGRQVPSLEAHLWVRELSRINRAVTLTPSLSWHDDGPPATYDAADQSFAPQHLPAIFCRHCGRSGWLTAYEPGTMTPTFSPQKIRSLSLSDPSAQRALISAQQEIEAVRSNKISLDELRSTDGEDTAIRLLDASNGQFLPLDNAADDAEESRPDIVPVLMHVGKEAKDRSDKQACPACGTEDSIRYIGSAVATLLSVALSNMFGTEGLDAADKKSLVFADSVQDASHRAGFVQARSHAFALRTQTLTALGGESVPLDALAERLNDPLKTPTQRFHLLHPTIAERKSFEAYWKPEASAAKFADARTLVGKRLAFDLCLEFGRRSTVGRTLLLTGAATASVRASDADLLAAARAVWDEVMVAESLTTSEETSDATLIAWARTVVERIRQRGGIYHEWLKAYLKNDGNTFFLHRPDLRAQGMPGFQRGSAPSFPRVGSRLPSERYRRGVDSVANVRSWFARWTSQQLPVTTNDGAKLVVALLERLVDVGVLTTVTSESSAKIYALEMSSVDVIKEHTPAELRCNVCLNAVPAAPEVRRVLEGTPCLNVECGGHHEVVEIPDNYYRSLYCSHDSRAVVAREHTSLLKTKARATLERQFKSSADEPGAPNVLVATPTLEMGIDIGDLSTVMLSSLPGSVASYVQRVGRAGRLTGNSLVVALVQGRGHTLPTVQDPLSLINGTVQPPAAFLSAAEILRRQFTAYLVGRIVAEGITPESLSTQESACARDIFGAHGENFVQAIRAELPGRAAGLLAEFQTALGEHTSEHAKEGLERWVTGSADTDGTAGDSLDSSLLQAAQRWQSELETLQHRLNKVDEVLPDLQEQAEKPGATEQDKDTFRSANSALKSMLAQKARLVREHWIAAMERFGLLPSYRLLDDSVDLVASIQSQDPETFEWDTESRTYSRGLSSALTELAPGNTFYADRMRIRIDTVDLGAEGSGVQKWRVCPACSHVETVVSTKTPGSCPACGAGGWGDGAQLLDVVPMRKVSAEVKRDSASIDERDEERTNRRFHVTTTMSYDAHDVASEWYVEDTSFGARYLRRADIRWLNLGSGTGSTQLVAGNSLQSPLFRVCEYCGHLDSEVGTNNRADHRPWCIHAKSTEEHNRTIALGRQLRTEAVLLFLPAHISSFDSLTLPSLTAALKLGFRRVLGGNPDHLDITTLTAPLAGSTAPALLLHDVVPGGTGYLADFARPESVWELLHTAWLAVRECDCSGEGRLSCPDCLLPFAHGNVDKTSREVAEATLFKLLRGSNPLVDDAVPALKDWTITDVPTNEPINELETTFRHRLAEELSNVGATLEDVPSGLYTSLRITMPGERHTWTLTPQEHVPGANTTPDFLLKADDSNLPAFAIFTDGFAFHASEQINRVADDAAKRAALRELGYIPWAVTWADLDASCKEPAIAQWYLPGPVAKASQTLTIQAQLVQCAAGDPIRLLVQILLNPARETWEKVGDAAVSSAMIAQYLRLKDTPSGRPWAREAYTGFPNSPQHIAVDLALAASSEAVADPLFQSDWQWWLALSNVFSLRKGHTLIRAESDPAALPSNAVTLADTQKKPRETSISISDEWQAILSEAEKLAKELGPEAPEFATEAALLRKLAEMGLPAPAVGEEVNGTTTIAWPEQHVAIVMSDPGATVSGENDTWMVLDGTGKEVPEIVDAVVHALEIKR